MLKVVAVFSIAFVFLILMPNSFAQEPTVKISTEKETYYYGDYFTFTIEISKITDDMALLYLTDENGKTSSAIPFPISQKITTETFPFPFDAIVYPEGKWTFEIVFSGVSASTEFYLKDSGKIIIPVWIKDVGKLWVDGYITDNEFVAKGISELIKNELIIKPQIESSDTDSKIPIWTKTTTKWWVDGLISDNDYGLGLEYLIKHGVIIV
jgi:hypothetical protein